MAVQPSLDKLLSTLMTTGLQQKDPALFQVISQLIKATKQLQDATITTIVEGLAGLADNDFITHTDEAATLPNSRQLLAGIRITFDDSVLHQRTLDIPIAEVILTGANESASLPNSRRLLAGAGIAFDDTVANQRTVTATRVWSVLTDGDVINPEIMFAGGEVIMVSVP